MVAKPEPTLLRIFPLSNVVLFPGVAVPLHAFEPRYRQLVAHALAGNHEIGMVAVPPAHADQMGGDPPVSQIGCAGSIEQARELPDGRYDVVLHGTRRFRILDEPARPSGQLYRTVRVAALSDPTAAREITDPLRRTLADLLRALLGASASARLAGRPDSLFHIEDPAAFGNAVCQLLDLPVAEKQRLLEADGCVPRLTLLIRLLGFALAERSSDLRGDSEIVH